MKYATVDQLKNHLEVTDTSRDSYFDEVLTRASSFVDEYTGRKFGATEFTVTDEQHEHLGGVPFTIWLRSVGITSIVALSGRDKQSDAWTELLPSDYDWTRTGRLDIGRRYRYIKVTYKYGGNSTVPADVELATLELAAAEVASGVGDVTRTKIGDLEMNFKAASTDTTGAYARLDRYRVRSI